MSTADLFRAGAAAQAAGKELDSNTIGNIDVTDTSGGGDVSNATVDSEGVFRADESTVDNPDSELGGDAQVADSQPSPKDAKASASKDKPKAETSSKEVITISDDKGKRQVEIDWNDKDALKKQIQMGFGARKWQAERDQYKSEATKLKGENVGYKDNWQKIEQAYQGGGIAGLIDFIEGQGTYQNHIKKELHKARVLESGDEEAIDKMKSQERVEKLERDLESERKQREKFTKEITSEREAAELASAQSRVYPVFSKYRFSEKLGDSNDEHMFDEMLWNTSMKRLEAYEEQGMNVSPELIEREFRTVAQSIRKRIGVISEKRATQVVEQKKKEATENVQAKVLSGYKTGGNAKEARDLLNSGNTSALLKGWTKYGSLFGSK